MRKLKALHITYRFGRDVVGGAERYLYMLSKELVRQGVQVDVLTTRTQSLRSALRFGVFWDNAIVGRFEDVDGIHVYRFPVFNLPKVAVLLFCSLLQGQWDKEEPDLHNVQFHLEQSGVLGTGWHLVECYDQLTMRWTKKTATFIIGDEEVSGIYFTARSPKHVRGVFTVNGSAVGEFQASESWQRFVFPLKLSGRLFCEIRCQRTWRPFRDSRRLGLAICEIGYFANGREKGIGLDENYTALLAKDELLAHYIAQAEQRPRFYDFAFFLLRSPLSAQLLLNLWRRAKEYDVILGQMTPFGTLNYAVYFGKRHGVPVVLLPHFHMEDDFYHWRHYYDAFRRADVVLAVSEFTKKIFFNRIGAKTEVVGGGGVDPAEFQKDGVPGNNFRKRFGLEEDVPLILFVGRKSPTKRYDLLIKAADRLNEHLTCKLLMIGPDEDQRPIASKNVLYLGKQDRDLVIDAYHVCDVFAMMSESESFGIVFLEAWVAKKPVIGNRRCDAVATLIEDGVDGFLCSDEYECAERIADLLLNKSLARTFGENGYEKVVRDYTWQAIGNKVRQLYEELANAPG